MIYLNNFLNLNPNLLNDLCLQVIDSPPVSVTERDYYR